MVGFRSRISPLHVGLAIPWIVAVIAGRLPIRDNSFLWHVRAGSLQIDQGSVLLADPFSFTRAGEAWRTQSWLLELGYAWLDDAFSLGYVQWLVTGMALLILTALMLMFAQSGGSLLPTVLLGSAAAWMGASFLSPRPVITSYLMIALVVLVGERPRLRWALPLIGWVWGSVHASFPLAIIYLLIVSLKSGDRKRLIDPIALGLPTLFTAHGWGVVEFLTGFVSHRDALRFLTEWATPSLTSTQFLLVIPSVLVLMYGMSKDRLNKSDLWIIGFSLFAMVSSARSVFPSWIFLAPLLARSLHGLRIPGLNSDSQTSRITVVLGVVVLVLPFVIPTDGTGLSESKFPLDAAHELRPGANIFHDDVAGGYLIYQNWPVTEVFVDDRAELYGAEMFEDVINTRSGTPQWREVFEEWEIDQVLARPDEALVEALVTDGWHISYEDDYFAVLEP